MDFMRETWLVKYNCSKRIKPVSYTHLDVYKRQILTVEIVQSYDIPAIRLLTEYV